MRNILVLFTVLFLTACGSNLDSSLQSFGNELVVLFTDENDPNCSEQIWSLAITVGVDETTKAGGQFVVRGMDPIDGLTIDLMDHQTASGAMSFSVYKDDPYSWHIDSLEVNFLEASTSRIRADYVLVMLDGTTRRGSLDAPVAANPGGCN